jgi:hypothetical protein
MENTGLVVREAVPGISGRFHGRKWTGRASRRLEMSQRGITGPESVAVVYGRLGHSWSVESVKRGLSACTVESPLTMVSNEVPLLPPSIAPQNRSAPFPVAYILLLTMHICNSPSKIRSIDSEQGIVENLAMSDIDKEIEKWKRIKVSAECKAKSRMLPEARDDDPCVGCWFLSSTDVFIFDNRVGIPSSMHKGKLPIKKVSSVLDTVVEVVVPSSKPKAKPPVKKVNPVPNSDVKVVPSSNHKGKKPAKIDTPSLDSDAES